ncbi:DNA-repair protein XRCC1-like protein [Drosera capensis]
MSTSKRSPDGGATSKLPSWMGTRESKSQGKKQRDGVADDDVRDDAIPGAAGERDETRRQKEETTGNKRKSTSTGPSTIHLTQIMEGVVVVLSGFVNPERGMLRSQALEMGAEFQQDWNSNCTLLVCAFPNTPKFRQVEADCGTIVSKVYILLYLKYLHIALHEWIRECHMQKRLVEIDSYLMHAGRPWKRSNTSHEADRDSGAFPPRKALKSEEVKPRPRPNTSTATAQVVKSAAAPVLNLSPLKVKRWASDDFNKTISWLESQDEKPEPSEMKNIAAEGILTCLQDAIDLLNNNEDLHKLTEQWSLIPHVIEELIKMEADGNSEASQSKEDLHKHALSCKEIYEQELNSLRDDSYMENRKPSMCNKHDNSQRNKIKTRNGASSSSNGYDSDETIEMTEEEIQHAYERVASKLHKA